ncbi:MAG TPA: molybdopterin-synthase adenylyltransferase MoeB [Prosthecobacter sp.]|nr:molybdopterin-synthase adenylyltransferase MoeB [Prosthecobacter sp.]
MPGPLYDCYVPAPARSVDWASRFLDQFLPEREASFDLEDQAEVLGLSRHATLVDVLAHLENHPDLECHCIGAMSGQKRLGTHIFILDRMGGWCSASHPRPRMILRARKDGCVRSRILRERLDPLHSKNRRLFKAPCAALIWLLPLTFHVLSSQVMPDLAPAETRRYARHLAIPEFGIEGQRKLKGARVLCIGAGGLGSPVTMYLAAAGVGGLGLVDPDVVEVSNLQRQLLFGEKDIGRKKLEAARERLLDINPHLHICLYAEMFTAANAINIAADYDVIIDGTDNFPTRYLSNDVAVWLKKPNVYGSILRFEGQVGVFAPHLGAPCYRCMAPQPPKPGLVPSCAEGGVLGVLPGLIGTMQALEAIKLITGIGQPLLGKLLHVDTLSLRFRTFTLRRDPECPVCGENPTITEPIDYQGFCGMTPPPNVPTITVHELQQLRERGEDHFLLDVREPDEFEKARISGSTLIPLGSVSERAAEIPRDRKIVVHCKSGGRSARAVAALQDLGYDNVWNVAGGISAWSEKIDPTVPAY